MSSRPTTPITASDLNRDLPPLPPRSHSNTSTPLPDQLPRRSSGSSFLPPRLRTSQEGSTLSRTSTDVTANSESTYVNANVDDAEWHSEDDTAADTVSLKGKGMETTAKNAKDGRIDVRLYVWLVLCLPVMIAKKLMNQTCAFGDQEAQMQAQQPSGGLRSRG